MNCVPVLMYHHIAADREVSPKEFEKQLDYLKSNGYTTPSMRELYRHVTGLEELSGKNVVLSFDDGYADNWICAWPMLQKYGFRAVIFPVTGRIELSPRGVRPTIADGAKSPDTRTDERGPGGFLSWDELKIMSDSKVFEIGSHTHSHNDFDGKKQYSDVRKELSSSKDLIEKYTHKKVVAMAWPWGYYQEDFIFHLLDLGYKLAFTTRPGSNMCGTDPLRVERFKVQSGSIAWLQSRLAIYETPYLGGIYGRLYGLDRVIGRKLFRKK